jgi:hypothetical protein
MITVIRLLRDLDLDLGDTGVTGGIDENICITRAKDRFGHPTSGGWADFMVNFYFKDDEGQHICEVQLVHSQMYILRQKMGAHKTYGQFRGAKEILEMLDLDPEDSVDANVAQIIESLVWTGAGVGVHGSSSEVVGLAADNANMNGLLEVLLKAQDAKFEALFDTLKEQQAKFETLEANMEILKEQNALLLAKQN